MKKLTKTIKKFSILTAIGGILTLTSCGNNTNNQSNESQQQSPAVNVETYKNGYYYGEQNQGSRNRISAYQAWEFANAGNQAGITRNVLHSYDETWEAGYNDGYNGRTSKY